MGVTINGWDDIEYSTATISGSNQTVDGDEYLIVIPANDGDSVKFITPIEPTFNWIMEVANGDPTLSKNVDFIGGTPGANPPEIFIPPPFTKLRLAPTQVQRFAFIIGTGWAPLLPGVLV